VAIDFPSNPVDGQRSNGYYYDASVGAWKSEKVVGTPSGVIMPFAGAVAPLGFLMADGSTLNRADYPELFAVLGGTGSPYGLPSGTTFKLPDLRSRVPVGYDNPAPWSDFRPLARIGGERAVTLTNEQLPAHSHPNTLSNNVAASSGHTHQQVFPLGLNSGSIILLNPNDGNLDNLAGAVNFHSIVGGSGNFQGGAGGVTYERYLQTSGGPSASTTVLINNANNTGGGGSHTNLQPYIVLNFIIKT
jgi:microcystin-dependent protein